MTNQDKIVIYKKEDGSLSLNVKLEKETVWLNAHQIAGLFEVDRTSIVKHIKNIYNSNELSQKSTCEKIAQVARDERIRKMNLYNLDVIISVGYRVNSTKATKFRIWANKILKDYLIKGYALNQKRLQQTSLEEFENSIQLIKRAMKSKKLNSDEQDGLLKVITDYADSWLLLQKYDENKFRKIKTKKAKYKLDYQKALKNIIVIKKDLIKKKEASELFGKERESSLEGILKTLSQTFNKKELYPGIGEKAAHLLYFIIKDHPFIDGNKRIGSFLFILFLSQNNYLFNSQGERKFNNNALVALALLVAQSDPKQKELMINLIINLIK